MDFGSPLLVYAPQVPSPIVSIIPDLPGFSKLFNHVTVISPPVRLLIFPVSALIPEVLPLFHAVIAHFSWRHGATYVRSSWLDKGGEVLHPVLNFDSFTVRCIPIVPAGIVPRFPLRAAPIFSVLPAVRLIVEAVAVGWKKDPFVDPITFFFPVFFLHGLLDTLGGYVLGTCKCESAKQG